jgi:hypothetical protein
MLKRRTILLLAAVMALGAAFIVPTVCVERGAEVCAVACMAERQCEQQEIGRSKRGSAEAGFAPVSFLYEPPQTLRFEWPASYQRPPTHSPLI